MIGKRILGLAALGALLVLSAPVERAEALSLSNPAAATALQGGTKMTTEVRWHYHHHWGWHRWHHGHWHRWHHHWHRWHHRHWHHWRHWY